MFRKRNGFGKRNVVKPKSCLDAHPPFLKQLQAPEETNLTYCGGSGEYSKYLECSSCPVSKSLDEVIDVDEAQFPCSEDGNSVVVIISDITITLDCAQGSSEFICNNGVNASLLCPVTCATCPIPPLYFTTCGIDTQVCPIFQRNTTIGFEGCK